MKSKKTLLRKSLLCLILDKPAYADLARHGVGMFQLRDKLHSKQKVLDSALKLAGILDRDKALFIVNDYPDIAALCGADGVHLGQDDLGLKQARMLLGEDKIIGVSCHSLAQARQAQEAGADYIGIGPVYPTVTKPGCRAIGVSLLRRLKGKINIPCFAIGGIDEGNIGQLIQAGVSRAAVCRSVLEAPDPSKAAAALFRKLKGLQK